MSKITSVHNGEESKEEKKKHMFKHLTFYMMNKKNEIGRFCNTAD